MYSKKSKLTNSKKDSKSSKKSKLTNSKKDSKSSEKKQLTNSKKDSKSSNEHSPGPREVLQHPNTDRQRRPATNLEHDWRSEPVAQWTADQLARFIAEDTLDDLEPEGVRAPPR